MQTTPSDKYDYLTASSPSDRDPPKISIALSAFGGISIVSSILFFAGSFYIENDIGKAFCLGAFFSGLLGSILLFGFAKVIDQLDAIRAQAESAARRSSVEPGDDEQGRGGEADR